MKSRNESFTFGRAGVNPAGTITASGTSAGPDAGTCPMKKQATATVKVKQRDTAKVKKKSKEELGLVSGPR